MEADRYMLTLYRYDTRTSESKEITDTIEGSFKPSDKSNEVLLICIYSQEGRFVPITYRIAIEGG